MRSLVIEGLLPLEFGNPTAIFDVLVSWVPLFLLAVVIACVIAVIMKNFGYVVAIVAGTLVVLVLFAMIVTGEWRPIATELLSWIWTRDE